MRSEEILSAVLICISIILGLGYILRLLRQPYVIGYIVAGILLGPHFLNIFQKADSLQLVGAIGVNLFLFFVGMEVSLPKLLSNWRVSIFGTLLQIFLCTLCGWVIGDIFGWSLILRILIGFSISLSSTSVVLNILSEQKEINTTVGQDVLGILLVQDILVAPMIIILGMFSKVPSTSGFLSWQLIGAATIFLIIFYLLRSGYSMKSRFDIKFLNHLKKDHELQIFLALAIALGISLVTSVVGLSAAFGAFLAGILISTSEDTKWLYESLYPFRVVLFALFFVSVGILVNLDFLKENFQVVLVIELVLFIVGTVINSAILRFLGRDLKASLYGGALLAQVGEFSFVLAAMGSKSGYFNEYAYQMTITVIAFSLVLSPIWIHFMKLLIHYPQLRLSKSFGDLDWAAGNRVDMR
jgi:CPA2 family monovalent cation:H+ antiporter-2